MRRGRCVWLGESSNKLISLWIANLTAIIEEKKIPTRTARMKEGKTEDDCLLSKRVGLRS